ncbi:hypothetical protein KQI74_15005 [Paenibacillus barcinonensis]|uniref:hypothetical protein n=1 Tax=Paenibacillus barcinonensis TaxID=198119 RepID=UPI001C12188C|nr:hypothetical protein [Paenibacillus barcinonensis]MBU5353600.1 hypothetical protein [Paenibacillus barcinonensis]
MYRPAITAGLFDAVKLSLHSSDIHMDRGEKGDVPSCRMAAAPWGANLFLQQRGAK